MCQYKRIIALHQHLSVAQDPELPESSRLERRPFSPNAISAQQINPTAAKEPTIIAMTQFPCIAAFVGWKEVFNCS
jgi:hypothetical protein